jgi:serine phosphatase RsbU (regulator of sigma subunit)
MDWEKTVHLDLSGKSTPDDEAHFLVVVNGSAAGTRIEIDTEARIIGRSETAGIRLEDPGISGLHCLVRLEDRALVVEDLDSTNGTFVDGRRVTEATDLPVGSILQAARTRLRHEVRSEEEIRRDREMKEELERAVSYVRALLPVPLTEGPVRTEWRFIPSAHLGGDAFGYHRVDPDRIALYLLDVCGHGVGAALHSVSAVNSIRRQTLAGADYGSPASVLAALNRAYPMDEHGEMFFTMWYGVYEIRDRRIRYASAGHPPAYLFPDAGDEARPLRTKAMPIGILPTTKYYEEVAEVPPDSRLYVFSDGAYEIVTEEDTEWRLEDLVEVLAGPPLPGMTEPDRIEGRIRTVMKSETFTDDFSLLHARFVS